MEHVGLQNNKENMLTHCWLAGRVIGANKAVLHLLLNAAYDGLSPLIYRDKTKNVLSCETVTTLRSRAVPIFINVRVLRG